MRIKNVLNSQQYKGGRRKIKESAEASADKPLVWMRFIDDVFFIWTHGEEKLKSFINHLNSSHETIKFTSEQSRDRISFLDVQVSVGEGGVLSTDLFCKPADTHQYLHKKSCHPWHTKKAIPYGQALRFRRIYSEDRQFQERVGELAGWLKDRGYEESLVNEQIDRVRRLDRTALLANAGNRTNDQGRGKGFRLLRHIIQCSIVWGRLQGDSILCSRIRRSMGGCFLSHL